MHNPCCGGHSTGEASQQEKKTEHLCHRYVAQKVSGVFFAPLEYTPEKDANASTPNCAEIGAMAMVTMLRRAEKTNLPTRDILLQTDTVVRRSCGTHRSALRNSLT
jgi:hypothetical protein